MADIRLSKAPSGTNQTIACTPDSRFVFDFPTDEATMARAGDNLVFTFDDGGSIELTDFYTTYNSEKMPDFEVDGAEISGTDFFTAMNAPDLMPAAGPAAQQDQASRHDADWTDSALYSGLDRLEGLDLGFERAEGAADDLSGLGMDDGDVPLFAETYGEGIPPAESEPDVPGSPDDNRNPGVPPENSDPEGPGEPDPEDPSNITGHAESSDADFITKVPHEVTVEGLPDGAALIDGTYEGTYGKITVQDGTISYIQDKKTYEHPTKGEEREGLDVARGADQISVSVRLGDGSETSFTVSVDITDDVPRGVYIEHDVVRGEEIEGNIFKPASGNPATAGADGLGRVEWTLPEGWKWTGGSTGPGSGKAYCENHPDNLSVTLNADGTYTFTALGNLGGIGGSIAFDHTIYDKDGDWSEGKLDFNPKGDKDIMSPPKELEAIVSEAALPDGSQNLPDADGKKIGVNATLKIPEGYEVVGGGAEGTYGKIVRNEDGSWSYQLTKQFDNSDAINDKMGQDTVTITLKDDQGNEYNVDVKVSILDDAPVITSAEDAQVEPVTETLFPAGPFDFTFGDHSTFKSHSRDLLGDTQGWERKNDGFSALDSSSGLLVSGGMYTYAAPRQDGYMELSRVQRLGVFYSASGEKYRDHESVSQGKQDGLTVGEVEGNDGSYSPFEIGAVPNGNEEEGIKAEGICFDLQGQIAHSVTVNLGAFFSAGSGNDWGQTYDPIPERALLTFYDKAGNIVKQMEVQADSQDGQYTQSIDCYVAGGFSSFVVSALDNVKWAQDQGISYTGNADSDFVVQSVEFHKIIGIATGTVEVRSGADGLHASMNGYAALFDLEAMQGVIQDAFDGKATLEPDGEAGFLVKAGDTILFAAEIDQKGTWTLTQFESFEKPINLKFYTQDGDGDKTTTDVTVNPYHGEAQGAQLAAYGDAMDDDSDAFLFALGNDQEDAGNEARFDDAVDDFIVYDPTDYLVQGGDGIDFLLSGNDERLHLRDLLDNDDPDKGPLVSDVEVLLKGDAIDGLTSLGDLKDYGITVEDDKLSLSGDWSGSEGTYTYNDGDKSLTLETTLTPVPENDETLGIVLAMQADTGCC